MQGFKSFAKHTELIFGDKFNVIVGPNGSGKSNIYDALCFVLGKSSSRSLRAEKAQNLIYNGGKERKPAAAGEVAIYFDNTNKVFPTEEAEVKISRIVKPNGQSTYKINNQKRTRQQILDLLAFAKINPDGYNIILQGDIVHFIDMPPTERREIIEEIAGISVYEEKKQKALGELDKVGEKLKEASIILAERATYLKELKKDRDHALKYKELDDKIKQHKASYLHLMIKQKAKSLEKFETGMGAFTERIKSLSEKIAKDKEAVASSQAEVKTINEEIERRGEQEQLQLHKQVEELRVTIATSQQQIASHKNEVGRLTARREQLVASKEDLDKKITGLTEENSAYKKRLEGLSKDKEHITLKIAEFRKKHSLDNVSEIERGVEELEKSIEQEQEKAGEWRVKQQELLREKDKIEYQINMVDQRIAKMDEVEKENKKELENLKQKKDLFKKITVELNTILNEDSSLAVQIANKRERLLQAKEELAKVRVRNAAVTETAKGSAAVNKIIDEKKRFPGVYGTVADLGSVPSKYAVALERAAGPRLRSIIVDSDKTAADCIRYLKENKLGHATFLPLNKIKGAEERIVSPDLIKANGSHGLALGLIDFDKKFKNAFGYVFGNTIIVESIDVARRIGIGSARMVSLDGDLAELSGAMQGGFFSKRSETGFKEKELTENLQRIEREVDELVMSLEVLEKRRRDNDEKITQHRESKHALEGDIIKEEKALHLDTDDLSASQNQKATLQEELSRIIKEMGGVEDNISSFTKKLTDIKIKREQLRGKIKELRNPALLAELNTFEHKRTELSESIITTDGKLRTNESQLTNVLVPETEKTEKIIKQLAKEEAGFAQQIGEVEKSIKKLTSDLVAKEEQEKKFYSQFKNLFTKRDKINEQIQKLEVAIIKKEEEIRGVEQQQNASSIEAVRIKAEISGLEEDYKEYHGIKVIESKSIDDLKADTRNFERSLAAIGSVNMRALEIYEKVEVEYNNLLDKERKLSEEKEEIIGMMNEIDSKKSELFMKTFDLVNTHFQEIFGKLTTKGAQAYLEIEDPEHIFENGVLIKVKITGTRFMDIRSLSGGEKTLTALAFIFAIQEFDPASFYVLDEVDAALDKHNSEQLAQLIQKYAEHAQYITASHNDQIISAADTIYGVSMNEHGMSSVVSLKL
ncbi:MAG: chromosome segregation protein [archaeon GW2011_AR4]|nr:MAG: chromosome segregation protein [archaeon GW2011_AR4]